MRFRTAILIDMLLVIFGALAATLIAVKLIVDGAAVRSVRDDSRRSPQVFQGLMAQRRAQAERTARVSADEPRLRALAHSDADHATVVEVARDVYKAMGVDVFVLIDEEGGLLVDMLAPDAPPGQDMMGNPEVAEAFERVSAAGIWVDDRRAYEVQAQRMDLDSESIGMVVIGQAISDVLAAAVLRQTGNALVVLLDGKPIAASTLPGASLDLSQDELGRALARVMPGAPAPVELALGGTHFLAVAGRFAEYRGSRDLRYVLLRNLDQALAPGRQLTKILFWVLLAAVLAALALALLSARRVSRPLEQLMAFTQRIAAGDLRPHDVSGGFAEVSALGVSMNRMAGELDESRQHLAEKERLENELRIASRIQASILPVELALPGLEIAARMDAADEVGGDYYDILPAEDGGWIGIGDVAGHGLDAGLVMLMAQTGITSLVTAAPDAPPSQVLVTLNQVLYGNVKTRLHSDRYMTLSLLRYHSYGRLLIAGAHLEIVRLRNATCELLPTYGTWIALAPDISSMTMDVPLDLEDGDLLVLYTDGLTEAANAEGEHFGIERVTQVIEAARTEPVATICERVFAAVHAWARTQEDDITVLVMRYARRKP